MVRKLFFIAVFSLSTLALAVPSQAQHRGGGSAARGGAVVRGGGAVVRGGGAIRGGGFRGGARPYYYPRYSFGFGYGYPYYYSPYYYPYGYYGDYGYPYGYPYPYGYGGYYIGGDAARGLGGLQIKDAPKDAQVFADGYYAGTVDDFDGVFQHLDLEGGAHRIEIREPGRPPVTFEVNIIPGENITYHAR